MSIKQIIFIALLIVVLAFLHKGAKKDSPIDLLILVLFYVTLTSSWNIPTFRLKGVYFASNALAPAQILLITFLSGEFIWEKIQEALATRRLRLKEFGLPLQSSDLLESLAPLARNERRVAYGVAP